MRDYSATSHRGQRACESGTGMVCRSSKSFRHIPTTILVRARKQVIGVEKKAFQSLLSVISFVLSLSRCDSVVVDELDKGHRIRTGREVAEVWNRATADELHHHRTHVQKTKSTIE
eukprot:1359730-Amphidinium_carterae.1